MALNSDKTAESAALSMLERKAGDVRILDLRRVSSIADYFVIGTVDSEPQLRAAVDKISEDLATVGVFPWHVEGVRSSRWVLLDFVDVVVHLFRLEARPFYGLERLWGDVPTVCFALDETTGEVWRTEDSGAQQPVEESSWPAETEEVVP